MTRLVKVNILDEVTKEPTGKTEDFMIWDEIDYLIQNGTFFTDGEGIFFQRQLEYIQAQSYDVLYPDLAGRDVFALNTEGGEGINQITYRSYDKRGEAVIIAGKATDLPRGDIDGKEYTIDVRTIANAFGYSRQEIAAAKLTGMPLEQQKANATRRGYEEKINKIVWFGDAPSKLHGFFGGPAGAPWSSATRSVVAGSAADGDTTWRGTKTPDEVVADLTFACVSMYAQTKKIFRPSKLLMSVADKQFLINTPRSLQSDKSILTWFLENNNFIKSADDIMDINEVEGVYPASNTDPFDPTGQLDSSGFSVIAESIENMRIREPFPYIHLPVQYKGLEFEINCYGRFAGLEMVRPAAVQHHHGI